MKVITNEEFLKTWEDGEIIIISGVECSPCKDFKEKAEEENLDVNIYYVDNFTKDIMNILTKLKVIYTPTAIQKAKGGEERSLKISNYNDFKKWAGF